MVKTGHTITIPDLRQLRLSIRTKMILVSVLLLIIVIAVIGAINARQGLQDIDGYSKRLGRMITDSLRQAGRAQLQLLAAAARIALIQSDYRSLKTIVSDVKKQDERITKVSILDGEGKAIADIGPEISYEGFFAKVRHLDRLLIEPDVVIGAQRSMAFAAPVSYKDRLFGAAVIAYSLKPLEIELAKAAETKRRVTTTNLRNIMLVALIAGVLGTLLTVFQGMRILRPIRALAHQARRIAGGNFSAQVDITSHDEIGQLGDTFNHMSRQILSLMQDAQQTAALEREFELANSIQSSLVPQETAVKLSGIELSGFFKPASHCGGDWWNYYRITDTKSLIIIGDVTGHGVPAAMITAVVKGAASTMIDVSADSFNLSALLQQLNKAVHGSGGREFIMTSFVALYDAETRTLSYANAGHTFPYLYQAGDKQITSLRARGRWLGYRSSQEFEIRQVPLHPNDVIVWYTDGIVEQENAEGAMLGEGRFRRMILKHAQLPLAELQDRIVEGVYAFASGAKQLDDITMIVGRIGS